jgi:hypothetical protein
MRAMSTRWGAARAALRLGILLAVVAGISGTTAGSANAAVYTYYNIVNRNSGKCVQSTLNSDSIVQWSCTANTNQLWRLQATDSGYYKLISGYDNQCLDISGQSLADGANAHQYNCHGEYNQQFRFVATSGGYSRIIARHSGKCLEVDNRSLANGTVIQQYACNSNASRQWRLS